MKNLLITRANGVNILYLYNEGKGVKTMDTKDLVGRWKKEMDAAGNARSREDICRRYQGFLGDSGSGWLLWYWLAVDMGRKPGFFFSFGRETIPATMDVSCLVQAYNKSHERNRNGRFQRPY